MLWIITVRFSPSGGGKREKYTTCYSGKRGNLLMQVRGSLCLLYNIIFGIWCPGEFLFVGHSHEQHLIYIKIFLLI